MQLYRKYALYALIVITVVAAFAFVLSALFDFNSSTGTSLIGLWVPAMLAGYYYKSQEQVAAIGETIKYSAVFTAIQLVINGSYAVVILLIFPDLISFLSQINPAVLLLVLAIVCLISMLVSYLSFSFGVYTARKALEKQAIKNG
ncbi:MAG: ABZJ_00895 family protein [Hyphomicrobiales bacterium]